MKKLLAALPVSALVLAASLAGCGSHPVKVTHNLTSKVNCGIEYHTWSKGSGFKAFEELKRTLKPVVTAIHNHDKGQVRKDAIAVQNDIKIVQQNMPPNCVPNLDIDLGAVLTDFSMATNDGVNGKYSGAKKSLKLSVTSLNRVTRDAKGFLKS